MREDKLKITITGKEDVIPWDSFITVMRNLLAIFKDVDASVFQKHQATLEWTFEHMSMNSPMELGGFPNGGDGREVLIHAIGGIDMIQNGLIAIPPHFK